MKKSIAAVGTPSIHHSTFAFFTTTVFIFLPCFTFLVTTALYLSFSPAGNPFATTLYGVPFVGTAYPNSANVALKYTPTFSVCSTGVPIVKVRVTSPR